MADTKATASAASRIPLDEFLEVANNSVLRAILAQKLPRTEPWPFGPIIVGIIFNPPDIGMELRGRVAGK